MAQSYQSAYIADTSFIHFAAGTQIASRYSGWQISFEVVAEPAVIVDSFQASADSWMPAIQKSRAVKEQAIRDQHAETNKATVSSGFARFQSWSRWPDLNRRPADYESAALPTELQRPIGMRP